MIKLIIYDCDGVIVNTSHLHSQAFRQAVQEVSELCISEHIHQLKLEALSTKMKLSVLSDVYGLPVKFHDEIYKKKQEITQRLYKENDFFNQRIYDTVKWTKDNGYKLFCASNCIFASVDILLGMSKLSQFFYKNILSNEDVKNAKPSSEIFLRCMIYSDVNPRETIICEDSLRGRQAAFLSSAHVLETDFNQLCIEQIKRKIELCNSLYS